MGWLSPSPTIAVAVAIIGVGVACLPWTARNWMGAASHIGGLVLWPSVALSVMGAADSSTLAIPGGLTWLLNLAVFAVLPGMFIILPIYGARINLRLQGGAIAFCAAMLLILLFTSASAAAGNAPQSTLTSAGLIAGNLTPAAYSGVSRLYAGYANQPTGAFTYSFLQAGGTAFDVHWSSVRGAEATFTTAADLPSWTNPTTCTAPATQCGHLAVAIPVTAPPGRPELWTLNGGAETAIDDTTWHGQHGELSLYGSQYRTLLTDAANIPAGAAGATVTLKWPHSWDGRGAAHLPAP